MRPSPEGGRRGNAAHWAPPWRAAPGEAVCTASPTSFMPALPPAKIVKNLGWQAPSSNIFFKKYLNLRFEETGGAGETRRSASGGGVVNPGATYAAPYRAVTARPEGLPRRGLDPRGQAGSFLSGHHSNADLICLHQNASRKFFKVLRQAQDKFVWGRVDGSETHRLAPLSDCPAATCGGAAFLSRRPGRPCGRSGRRRRWPSRTHACASEWR